MQTSSKMVTPLRANTLPIDHSEQFPSLKAAPIVEAVVAWQAPVSTRFFDSDFVTALQEQFPDYSVAPQNSLTTGVSGTQGGLAISHTNAVQGARLEKNRDNALEYACQFLRNGVVFSKLAPYDNWQVFLAEGNRFWQRFLELGKPSELSSLSVRYISQIPLEDITDVGNHIDSVCAPLSQLGLTANQFFHQDSFLLSNKPYGINIVRAVQQSGEGVDSLIIDITAHTTDMITDLAAIDEQLADLRFLKNKVFFNLLSNTTETFGGSNNV